jgi:aspartate/methionine/tyrosine aminotransferase
MTILFEDWVLKQWQFLKPANSLAWSIIEPLINGNLDKCFVYHLLASRGICIVPLSTGFNSDLSGFRITLLEPDKEKFIETMTNIAEAAREYMNSK